MLVESDSHDARLTTQLVWAAVSWIGRVKGWSVEGISESGESDIEWKFGPIDDEEELFDRTGKPVPPDGPRWTVKTLERNWARFLRAVD